VFATWNRYFQHFQMLTRSSAIAELPRDASYQLKSCQLHLAMMRSSRFHCPIGVINKLTTVELWISPVYRRLAVAKFSKSTM